MGIQNNLIWFVVCVHCIAMVWWINKLKHSICNVFVLCCIIEYFLEIFNPWKFDVGFFGSYFWSGIFGVFLETLGDFWGFWYLPPFNDPCHLKFEVPSLWGIRPLWEWMCEMPKENLCRYIIQNKATFSHNSLFLLMFNCFAFFRITAHINVVRALLGQMSCSVTWESTQKKRHTCAVYAKRLLAAVIIWASTLELMTPVGKRMFRIRTVMVKNLATRMVQNSSVMLMITMMCLMMITKKIIELMDRLTLDWKDGKPLVIKNIQNKFQRGQKLNGNQTITLTSQCTWFFEEEWILLIIFEILFRIIFVIYSLIEAQLGSILEYLFNFMVNILKPWVKFCCSAKVNPRVHAF